MQLHGEDLQFIAAETIRACQTQAKIFGSDQGEAIEPVFDTIVRRLSKRMLTKPLPHYVRKTARLEARRYFRRERQESLRQIKQGRESMKRCSLYSLGLEQTLRWNPGQEHSDVADELALQEELAMLFQALGQLPPALRDVLMNWAYASERKGGFRGLARERGVSCQQMYKLRDSAIVAVRNILARGRIHAY